jgi:glutaminyl-tRNA synthetase
MAVLDPVKLVIENYPDEQGELMEIANHPQKPEMGARQVPFAKELWIEREDYQEVPAKGYFRMFPGNTVRLRHGYVVKCTGHDKASDTVRCIYYADSKSGTEGANKYKVKGNIHWVSVKNAFAAGIRSYDRLFKSEHPEGVADLNPASKVTSMAQLEPSLEHPAQTTFQFERHGYYTVDSKAPRIFNRTVTLRDSWASAKPS